MSKKDSDMSTRHGNNSPELHMRGDEHFSAGCGDEPLSHSEIAARAYTRWQQRGCPEGTADEDWFEAERQCEPRELVAAG